MIATSDAVWLILFSVLMALSLVLVWIHAERGDRMYALLTAMCATLVATNIGIILGGVLR